MLGEFTIGIVALGTIVCVILGIDNNSAIMAMSGAIPIGAAGFMLETLVKRIIQKMGLEKEINKDVEELINKENWITR